MLVLTRKKQQSIQIGDDITITVVSIQSNKVRIGIDAPKDKYRVSRLDEGPNVQSSRNSRFRGGLH